MSELKTEHDAALAQLTGEGAPFELAGDEASGRYYRTAPNDLIEALSVARAHGDKEFLVYEGERRSFNQLFGEADALAAALQAQGISPGERIAIAMRNYPEWMVAFLAGVMVGAVVVPLNSWGQPADIAYTIADAGATLVVCDQQRYDGLAEHLRELGVTALIARGQNPEHECALEVFVKPHVGAQPAPVSVRSDDLAMIMYTSGTSGKPKGAASTHYAVCQAITNMECSAMAFAMNNGDTLAAVMERGYEPTSLLAVPLFHVSGCHAQFFINLRAGRRLVMMYKWDVERALDYIESERITMLPAAPAMLMDLLESPKFDETDTSSLFSVGVGGAATPPKIGKLLAEKVPQNFSGTGWGMTETNAQGASLTGKAWLAKSRSAGYPHPIVSLRICDEDGNTLPPEQAGEIWVRSCSNIREYWNRPEANATEIRDGWLRTGDIGYVDADGFLYLADRAKDMIIRGGENIYPIEVENVLIEHPAVKEVAAIGLPHERLGEEVCAVVHAQDEVTEAELLAFAKDRLAAFKVPARVVFEKEPLPRNATNKVLKAQVRAAVLEQLGL